MTIALRTVLGFLLRMIIPLTAFAIAGFLFLRVFTTGLYEKVMETTLLGAVALLMGEYAFWVILVLLLSAVGGLSGHYGVIGPKHFSHDGEQIKVFSVASRINHWIAATSCSTLILTGLSMMAAAAPGTHELLEGTGVVQIAWKIHGVAAIIFAPTALFMLVEWSFAMLPRLYDIGWMKIAGGYLSKKKRPVPAHKFNVGQKSWYWVGTAGGMVMAGTGLVMNQFWGGSDVLNLVALVHHCIAAAIVALFTVHIYMVTFAIKGSFGSMINGHKSEEEVAILHSLYYKELQEKKVKTAISSEGSGGK